MKSFDKEPEAKQWKQRIYQSKTMFSKEVAFNFNILNLSVFSRDSDLTSTNVRPSVRPSVCDQYVEIYLKTANKP